VICDFEESSKSQENKVSFSLNMQKQGFLPALFWQIFAVLARYYHRNPLKNPLWEPNLAFLRGKRNEY
jgi:hypothetical protein